MSLVKIESLIMKPKEKKPDEFRDKSNDGFIFQRKYDGSRFVKVKNGLFSKRSINRRDRFSHIWSELSDVPAILDTEVYVPDGDVIDLNSKENWSEAKCCIFDVLKWGGEDYRGRELLERKEKLREIVENYDLSHSHLPKEYECFNEAWGEVEGKDWEGLVVKNLSGRYYSGERCGEWVKVKRKLNGDFEIVGHSEGKEAGAFVCRTDEGVEFKVNVARVEVLEEWRENGWGGCEVSFQRWTDGGRLFHPVFEKFIKKP